jgi:hypothetical protein
VPATALSRVLLVLAVTVLLGLGLSTYTLPNHGGGTYQELHDLIAAALGDTRASLPGPPHSLPILPDSTLQPMLETGDTLAPAPPAWIGLAAGQDSAALRGWLGRAVLVTAEVRGDTVETTLWRVTLRGSCPLLSRLHATSVGRVTGRTRFVMLAADCPPVPGREGGP